MLYYHTISPGTLRLLKELMSLNDLNIFRLVGGTSLALQLGHRISVDLDFFSEKSFDINQITTLVSNKLKPFELQSISGTGFTSFIENIKCDFYNWSVPYIREPLIKDELRLASLEDIAAFKLDAIIRRKEKKDFWDIDALLYAFPLKDLFSFYRQKFIYNDVKIVLDALSEIDIADESEVPIVVGRKTWDEVKENIKKNWKVFQLEKLKEKENERQIRLQKAEQLLKQKKKKDE